MSGTGDDDIERLREDAARTREKLGVTAEELVDRLDVPARAKAAARERGAVVQQKADETLTKAKSVAGHAMELAKENADTVGTTARQVGEQVRHQVDQLPEPVRQRGLRVLDLVRQRPAVVIAAVAAILAVLRLTRGRRR